MNSDVDSVGSSDTSMRSDWRHQARSGFKCTTDMGTTKKSARHLEAQDEPGNDRSKRCARASRACMRRMHA
jgi:hypothetical protein